MPSSPIKRTNLKQLAHELNLSISTVSRALNDSYEIAADTKERVRQKAQELGYEPNPYASGLRSRKSKTIGLVIPEVANNFFSLAIDGVEEIARANDYHVLIYLTHESHEREATIVQHLAGGRVDGILMSVASESRDSRHLVPLLESNVPLVFFDRVCEDIATARVTTDDFASGYRATEHLVEQGCRRIAHLLISDTLSIGQKRMDGYRAALRAHGLPDDDTLILPGTLDRDQNTVRIRELLQADPAIDGIFASVETLAISSYEACQELRRRVPEQVKIISFSNLATAAYLNPPLTTIRQPAYEMGKKAAEILFRAISKNRPVLPSQSAELQSTLVPRRSTGG
ncbi:LacI family transcriptional regulator [Hymenobacter sp. 15J16-1T3B]|uniref:LacI family DNA-binding transcriptional regulator n=1 Tax=Hymenobacter sp. 15J16-1T3B TaxID=2886941 RepID=UPI001D108622|nr:LacI family DNA-binding transcriptional regulator [Hymenobacter sp. 15J16-1T3B]MCC3156673.1 LacI family transcriptional regulator [Hymenobacter sp. 15J16-1T3B]